MMGRVTTDRRYSVLHNINNIKSFHFFKNRMKNKSIIHLWNNLVFDRTQ